MGGLPSQGGGSAIDPRKIRKLTCDDKIDICDRSDRKLGSIKSIKGTVDVNVLNAINADIIDRCSRLLGQLCFGGVAIDPRDRNWDLNFATDQVDVSGSTITVTDIPTIPINDFNTGPNVASGSSSTHTYTATGNFKLTSIQASASGAMKIEVKTGTSGSETTKMVAFITESNLTIQLEFHEEIQITTGQRIQVIRTNREQQAMDIFSTILGFNT